MVVAESAGLNGEAEGVRRCWEAGHQQRTRGVGVRGEEQALDLRNRLDRDCRRGVAVVGVVWGKRRHLQAGVSGAVREVCLRVTVERGKRGNFR